MKQVGLVVMCAIALAAGCTASATPNGPPPPSPCPYGPADIQVNGDSLGTAIPRYLTAPNDGTVVNRARSRSGFTYEIPADVNQGLPAVPSIGRTIQTWIELCGPPALVVIQGGVADLAGLGLAPSVIQAAVSELSAWLEANNVPTLWVTVHPLPTAGTYMWSQPARQAYNAWLKAGNVTGDVVDCVPALEDPSRPDTLNPIYYERVDLWGTVDGVHPNTAGYQAMAACIQAAIPAALD